MSRKCQQRVLLLVDESDGHERFERGEAVGDGVDHRAVNEVGTVVVVTMESGWLHAPPE